MMFRSAFFALLTAVVSADKMDTSSSIPVTSNMGQELLVKATVIEESRHLNNNNNYDYTWMSSYSIRYNGCTDLIQVAGNGQGGNNKDNENSLLYTQHLVRFSICPADTCESGCSGGGLYVVGLNDFVDLYTEYKLNAFQLQCENVRENCDCENANDDDVCEAACYTTAGMSECSQEEGDDFEVQRYLECAELEEDGGNNNQNQNNYYYGNNAQYYYGQYYVGPYCPDGKSIYMGLFYDAGCSAKADISQYAARMGGVELPYSTKSIVEENDCIACLAVQENNDNNNNDNGDVEIAELCYTIHAEAAKCEENTAITYADTSACDYIKNVLPRLDAASRSITSKKSYAKAGKASKAFAFIFAFTTVLFAAYAYFLYRKIKRGVVALASQG